LGRGSIAFPACGEATRVGRKVELPGRELYPVHRVEPNPCWRWTFHMATDVS
jgi:hypothetical protein